MRMVLVRSSVFPFVCPEIEATSVFSRYLYLKKVDMLFFIYDLIRLYYQADFFSSCIYRGFGIYYL